MANLLDACERNLTEVAKSLLQEEGVEIDARDETNQRTALHWACDNGNMELAMALMDRGADVDARSVDEDTPLHKACYRGNMELAMALVRKGANVYSVNSDGNKPRCTPAMIDLFNRLWYTTPLMKAMLDRDMDTFEALLNDESVEVNTEIGDGYGWTVLHAAVDMHLGEYVTRLLQHDRVDTTAKYAPRSQTALHIACSKGDVAMVRLFVVI